jgi:hypothetical protein
MKVILLALVCTVFSLSASAQFFSFLKKQKRDPQTMVASSAAVDLQSFKLLGNKVQRQIVGNTDYSLGLNEHTVMKTAQHQMRFRQYEDASYSFAELARIYIRLNRLSEAKWFFLQSSNLSRQQNNDRLTISNLMELANIKATIGDMALAQQDLDEARSMAAGHNWTDDLQLVKKTEDNLNRTKLTVVRSADAALGRTGQAAL